MIRFIAVAGIAIVLSLGAGCKKDSAEETQTPEAAQPASDAPAASKASGDDHAHGPEGDHSHPGEGARQDDQGQGHHDEVSLGKSMIGTHEVSFSQGHGKVAAGKEGHLVVKLPFNDKGTTVVRAWIGTSDRTESFVGKGEYGPSHDDYDVHATAPDPLPADVMWWVEIQQPEGATVVGSIKPIL